MEKQLRNLIKENTKNEQYENNHALYLGKVLGFSRNWISSHLNDLYNNGSFIKINFAIRYIFCVVLMFFILLIKTNF